MGPVRAEGPGRDVRCSSEPTRSGPYPRSAGPTATRPGWSPNNCRSSPRSWPSPAMGANNPQLMVNQTALAIGRGELDVAVIVGADCGYTATATRKHPGRPVLGWTVEPPGGDQPLVLGATRRVTTDAEEASGINVPIHVFPLFENALRAAAGRSLPEHDQRMGALWARFSEVAATHPNAWITEPYTAEDIITVSESNRMVSFPYRKLLTGNMQVDQGAALIVCSAEAAEAAGVPRDRWVFPLAGADANDHWYLSHRADFHSSPAVRLSAQAAAAQVGTDIDGIGHLDLHSYFPSAAAEIVAAELGVGHRRGTAPDPHRRPHLLRDARQQLRHPRHRHHGGGTSGGPRLAGHGHQRRLVHDRSTPSGSTGPTPTRPRPCPVSSPRTPRSRRPPGSAGLIPRRRWTPYPSAHPMPMPPVRSRWRPTR